VHLIFHYLKTLGKISSEDMIWPMAPKAIAGRIKYASLGDDHERCSHRNDDNMSLLRIGKYVHNGEVIKATMQINDNVTPPPSTTNKELHRKLINDTRDIISKYMFHDRIDDVVKWVEMEDIYNGGYLQRNSRQR